MRAMAANPQIVPSSLDVAGARADLDALDALRPPLEQVQRLHAMLEDTVALLGHDVMDVAYDGYQQLKLSGAAHGLDDLRRELGAQFSRSRRRAEEVPQPARSQARLERGSRLRAALFLARRDAGGRRCHRWSRAGRSRGRVRHAPGRRPRRWGRRPRACARRRHAMGFTTPRAGPVVS